MAAHPAAEMPCLTVEACRVVLDVAAVLRMVKAGAPEAWARWQATGDAVAFPAVRYRFPEGRGQVCTVMVGLAMAGHRGVARLEWQREGRSGAQHVELVSTASAVAGRRWWWSCPRAGCHAAKLYLPPGRVGFASRRGHALVHASVTEDRLGRAARRVRRLRAALGEALPAIGGPLPPRPLHMSAGTYRQALEALREAEAAFAVNVP